MKKRLCNLGLHPAVLFHGVWQVFQIGGGGVWRSLAKRGRERAKANPPILPCKEGAL